MLNYYKKIKNIQTDINNEESLFITNDTVIDDIKNINIKNIIMCNTNKYNDFKNYSNLEMLYIHNKLNDCKLININKKIKCIAICQSYKFIIPYLPKLKKFLYIQYLSNDFIDLTNDYHKYKNLNIDWHDHPAIYGYYGEKTDSAKQNELNLFYNRYTFCKIYTL